MCVPSLSWQNDDLYIENVDQKPVSRNARHVVDVDVSRRALAHVDVRHGPIHLIAHTMYKQTPRRFCQDRLRPSVLSRQAQTVGFVKTGSDRRFCQDRLRTKPRNGVEVSYLNAALDRNAVIAWAFVVAAQSSATH